MTNLVRYFPVLHYQSVDMMC